MLKTVLLFGIALLAVIFMYALYSKKQLNNHYNSMNENPYSSDYYRYIGRICPPDYMYVRNISNKNICKNMATNKTIRYKSYKNWPTTCDDPGFLSRKKHQKNWPYIQYMISKCPSE